MGMGMGMGVNDGKPSWAARIQAERERRGWNKHQMARRLLDAMGTHYPPIKSVVRQIYWWESGRHFPRDWQHAYAAVFDTTVPTLFGPDLEPAAAPGWDDAAASKHIAALAAALIRPDPPRPETLPGNAAVLRRHAARAWKLRQLTDYRALADLLTASLPDISAAVIDPVDEAQHIQAISAHVHLHNAAASLLKRLRAPELAAIAADRAVQTARLINNALLLGAAHLRLSNVFLEADLPREALECAAGAADALLLSRPRTDRAVIATWGALMLTAAVAAARAGERAQAWELIGQAKTASQTMQEDYAGLHAIFGPTNVAIYSVQVATELRDPREALRRAAHISLSRLPPTLAERRSSLLLDIGRCHYTEGDHDSALTALLEAEHVAPQEVRYNPLAHGLGTDLLSTPTGIRNPELRAFTERLQAPA
jgi:tetratricopeptide (TPR) repeat protein